jgi:hypothetical protein
VLSAEAFHWISPEVGYPKAAAALKLGGAISLIWHYSPGSGGALHDALDQVYNEIAPELINPERHLSEDVWIARITEQIDTSACFGEVIFRCYPWSLHQSAEEYIRLLNTHSDHRQLNENVRQQLFSRIALLIGDFGGYLDKPYRTHLFVAHLRD